LTTVHQRFWPALAAAAALHAGGLAWLSTRPPPRLQPRRPPTTVRLVARERPPPAPAAPAVKAPPPPEPARLARLAPRAEAPPPPAPAPLPAPAAPAPAEAPRPRRFAVSLGATAPGGGVAVPVTGGPTAARGDPTLPASAPAGDNTAFARRPAPASDLTEVERLPRPVRQPSALDLRALYPEAARREGLEGDVRLELLVDERGEVAEVRVLEPAGHGFDEVAPIAARRIVFEPAQRGGRPVAVRIPWTLKFRLDG
jgi:protein TonB